jgi:hypothetical protein
MHSEIDFQQKAVGGGLAHHMQRLPFEPYHCAQKSSQHGFKRFKCKPENTRREHKGKALWCWSWQ